jgi:hypothetical protein
MNLEAVNQIAQAVLYEGYMLYPYRPTAVKNQQRFNFGVLYPAAYCEAQGGGEAWSMQTECLVQGAETATVEVRARFLHVMLRQVGRLTSAPTDSTEPDNTEPEGTEADSRPDFQPVDFLEVDGKILQTWQEVVEREVILPDADLADLEREPRSLTFRFPAAEKLERFPYEDRHGGVIIRRQEPIEGEVRVMSQRVDHGLFRITVVISNRMTLKEQERGSRDGALLRSMVSTHTMLGVTGGKFVSLLDPPEQIRSAAAGCSNIGTWPVLVGDEGSKETMLSSPIILYDYPQIAPESAGELFDGTEIDEILTLRIMTLTDEEKREMRDADERARKILERTETLPVEQWMKMHGAVRGLRRVAGK